MSWTIVASGPAISKAGLNATIIAANLDEYSDEAEGMASALARYDVVTNWTNLTAQGKNTFANFVSSWIAQQIINYDQDAIGRVVANLRLNVLENNINTAKQIITDKNMRTYLGIGTG